MNSIILRNIEYKDLQGAKRDLSGLPRELHYDYDVLPKIMEYCDNDFSARAVMDVAEELLGEDIKELFDSDRTIEEFCYSLPPIQIEIPLDKLMIFENEVMSEKYDGFYWYQREYGGGLQKDLINFLDCPADHVNGLDELKKLIVNMGYMASVIREKYEYMEMEKDL